MNPFFAIGVRLGFWEVQVFRGSVLKDEPRFEVQFSEGLGSLRFSIFRFDPTLILLNAYIVL